MFRADIILDDGIILSVPLRKPTDLLNAVRGATIKINQLMTRSRRPQSDESFTGGLCIREGDGERQVGRVEIVPDL